MSFKFEESTAKSSLTLLKFEITAVRLSSFLAINELNEYDKDWELVEIGAPSGKEIPLIFRKQYNDEEEKGKEIEE